MTKFINKDTHRLKILYICESYAPNYGGGAAIYVQDLCNFLAEKGHDVQVLCTEDNDTEPYTLRQDIVGQVPVHRVNLPYFRRQDPDGWQLSLAQWKNHEEQIAQLLNQFFDQWKPDIVNYNTARPLGEECLLTIARRSIPAVATLHEGWLICPRLIFLHSPTSEACSGPAKIKCLECLYSHYDGGHLKAFLKMPWRIMKLGSYPSYRLDRRHLASKTLKGAMAVSDFMKRLHEPNLPCQVKHIPLGINLTTLPKERIKRPQKPLRFGFVGGSQPIKGLVNILDSAVALRNEGLSFELLVWGSSQEICAEEIRTRRLEDCVRLCGVYQSDQLWDVYNEMDVALMATNVSESFGRVPLEAAAVGAITIAPAIGGLTESIRDGIDGLLFEFRNAKDLENQMRRLLTEKGLFEKLQANLKPVLDTKDAIDNVEKFYFDILDLPTHIQN